MLYRPAISLVLVLTLTGCAAVPTRCYVTLSDAGQPSAEACESGSHLRVRPITPENAAYYAPPYILAALANEGYLSMSTTDSGDELPTVMQSDAPVFSVDDQIVYDHTVSDRLPIFSLAIPSLSIELSLPRNEAASQAQSRPTS
ncbi:hypothetical protein [Aurantimonas sp. A3-2-R12]|uniref:hypothetical protein n=1 Tax=Aurantimonas sp. A3-2-R12 TaxID=3114362 RepID=UPI002E18C1AD|nr:hypothetical protein [Aurantimonas sp. A3-2-R12]